MAGLEEAERNTDSWWLDGAMRAVRELAATGDTFQCFDIVELFAIPEPDHPARWGALMRAAVQAGIVESVGAEPSRRPTRAAGLTRTWRGAR